MSERTLAVHANVPSRLGASRNALLQRQCACGNHTMAGGACAACEKRQSSLQRKLMIGASNDPLEQEADRIADRVLAMPTHAAASAAPPRIQRFSGQANGQMNVVPASVDQVLAGPGVPLERAFRQDMEQRFGHEFSRVRVHAGATADHSARDVHAHAYTVGRDIVFGAGRFAPGTLDGRRLIAHELAHVVQQSGAGTAQAEQDSGHRGPSGEALPPLIQRQPDPSPPKESPPKKQAVQAPKKEPATKTLKSEGVGLSDPVATGTATVIDEVLARNQTLAPYIGDLIKGGFRIAEKGKFVQDSSDGNFNAAYRKAYDEKPSENVSKDTSGFFDYKKSEVHVRPGAKFGTALHESVHRLATPALYVNYLQVANKVSTDLSDVLREGVTAFFTDLILKDEGLPNFNDGYRTKKKKAEKLINALGADGFDLIARFNFKGDRIVEIGEKLGYTREQFNAPGGRGIREVMKRMDKEL